MQQGLWHGGDLDKGPPSLLLIHPWFHVSLGDIIATGWGWGSLLLLYNLKRVTETF